VDVLTGIDAGKGRGVVGSGQGWRGENKGTVNATLALVMAVLSRAPEPLMFSELQAATGLRPGQLHGVLRRQTSRGTIDVGTVNFRKGWRSDVYFLTDDGKRWCRWAVRTGLYTKLGYPDAAK